MSLTPEQVRAARQLLGRSFDRLGGHVGVSASTISKFEVRGDRRGALDLPALRSTLEAAGVEFIAENGGGTGVRLRKRHE